VAARLGQLGQPVRHWIERTGPIPESFDDHLTTLRSAVNQTGPLVRGEVIRVAFGFDLFTDYPWDLAGQGAVGSAAARNYLDHLRGVNNP